MATRLINGRVASGTMNDDGTRKPGARTENYNVVSISSSLNQVKKLTRTDFGGHSAVKVLSNKATAHKLDFGERSLVFIKDICVDQVESCRKRTNPRLDNAIDRIARIEKLCARQFIDLDESIRILREIDMLCNGDDTNQQTNGGE